jgi:UDP-N-acetylglucosamine/UDP-N-acetylgalactosamine diphosphorylase
MAQTVRSRFESAAKILTKHNQQHLLCFSDKLNREQQLLLLEDIESLDFDLLDELVDKYVLQESKFKLPAEILAPPVYPAGPTTGQQKTYKLARERGECLIAEHKVAAFTVAGGMGTRLNYDGPKGNVPATPVRNKSLFRLFAENIIAVQRRFNCVIPWYIMTSQANHQATIDSFRQYDYFGLAPDQVMHFRQGMMPCFDRQGKILLNTPYRLALSPDGHGGSLRALYKSGALENMAQRGIEYISYFQVDNPSVYVIDPLFIGLHATDAAEMSSKAVAKCDPLEKVGNFTLADGKITVIEYSDLPEKVARKCRDDGRAVLEYGSIAIHIINRSFVERINQRGFSLPWHRAIKQVPFIDSQGKEVRPESPNAIKLETFVFDALPLATQSVILEVDRTEQFAPIKNASGTDSLQSSQQLQIERAARWMSQAGIQVPRTAQGKVDLQLEISPLFALDAHELSHKKSQLRPLKSGDIVYLG